MNRISVGQTIGRGYRFLFRRFFAVLGLSWLPALALGVALALWIQHFASDVTLAATSSAGPPLLWLALDGLALATGLAFLGAVIGVPVTREALGLRDETVFAHFVVGRRELRLFFALLRFSLLLLSATVLLALVLGFALRLGLPAIETKLGAAWHGIPLRAAVLGGVGFVALVAIAFVALRLGFFLMPIAAIEERARVTRSWMLASRNSWRILIVSIALALPVDLLARGTEYALFGRELQTTVPRALAAHDVTILFQWVSAHAAVLAAIFTTALALLIALFAGASALAYRALTPAADMQPVYQPSTHDAADMAGLPAVPAMAAPPLDLSLGEHQAPHDAVASPANVEGTAPKPAEVPATPEPAIASAIETPLPPASAGETHAAVLEHTPQDGAGAAHAEAAAPQQPATPAETSSPQAPETDVVENILPTGDPDVAPKERELKAAE